MKTIWFSESGIDHLCQVLSDYFGRRVEPKEAEAMAGSLWDKPKGQSGYPDNLEKLIGTAMREAHQLPIGSDEMQRMLAMSQVDGIMIRKTEDWIASPGSWLMGEPSLPPEIEWPIGQWCRNPDVSLHFVAQFNLSELPDVGRLPEHGTLFFFVDLTTGPDDM